MVREFHETQGIDIVNGHAPKNRRITVSRVLIGLGVLLVLFAYLAYRITLIPPDYPGEALSVAEAHKQAADGRLALIDVRRPDEWKRTGIPQGAEPLDMRRDDFVQALSAIVGSDKSQPIALICARGVRSAQVALRLTEAGFTHIIDVPEGMLGSRAGPGWLDAKLPTQEAPKGSD